MAGRWSGVPNPSVWLPAPLDVADALAAGRTEVNVTDEAGLVGNPLPSSRRVRPRYEGTYRQPWHATPVVGQPPSVHAGCARQVPEPIGVAPGSLSPASTRRGR